MPKPQDIFQLARQEAVRVTASPQAWQSFLYTAAHNYHTTYLNQLLIHAQRPDAAACASMEYWNKQANRLVMRGSRSITVLQRRQGVAVTKPVFAIGDTTLLSQTRTSGPWEVTDTTRPLLLQGKSDDWLAALAQEGVSNDADRARRMLERNVADSTLQWAQPDEQMQLLQVLVTQSAVYMARLRIGLPVQDEDYPAFQSVSQFDTCQISLCLGGYLQAAAEPMLNAIGREALRLNRDSIVIEAEAIHSIFFCQSNLLWQNIFIIYKIIIISIQWCMRLIMSCKIRFSFLSVCPFSESLSPPFIILWKCVKLWQIKRYNFHSSYPRSNLST